MLCDEATVVTTVFVQTFMKVSFMHLAAMTHSGTLSRTRVGHKGHCKDLRNYNAENVRRRPEFFGNPVYLNMHVIGLLQTTRLVVASALS